MKPGTLDITSLFIFRFVMDNKKDIVNLDQDIQELHFYPERLNGSYRNEWITYVKKRAYELKIPLTVSKATQILNELPEKDKKKFYELLDIIKKAELINDSDNINVIKTDVKAYIEKLLKL